MIMIMEVVSTFMVHSYFSFAAPRSRYVGTSPGSTWLIRIAFVNRTNQHHVLVDENENVYKTRPDKAGSNLFPFALLCLALAFALAFHFMKRRALWMDGWMNGWMYIHMNKYQMPYLDESSKTIIHEHARGVSFNLLRSITLFRSLLAPRTLK